MSPRRERAGAALAELVNHGAARDVALVCGSFRHELVAELAHAAPEIPRSVLFGAGWDVPGMVRTCRDLGAEYAHPCVRPIDASVVDGLHAASLRVMTPHTNDLAEAIRFVKLRVDVIASDDPRVLLALRS